MRKTVKAALTLAATMSAVTESGGRGRGPGVGEALPAAEHSPAVHGTAHQRRAARQRMRAALRADHRAEQLLRDHRGEQGGAANFPVTFALTAGSLPPGLTMSTQSGTSAVITGNPTRAGTFNFTIKAAAGGLTSTLTYQITVTVQGPPDQLVCTPLSTAASWKTGSACCPTP